jgi:molybdate/tungstate transport system substrate-binding protein
VDLVALLETNAVDYIFIYKSVAIQHSFKYLELPSEINLSDLRYNEFYNTVSLDVIAGSANSKMRVKGEYINYSLSVLDRAPNRSGAIDFVAFMLSDEGLDFLRRNGQEPIIPFSTDQPEMIPEKLSEYLITVTTE